MQDFQVWGISPENLNIEQLSCRVVGDIESHRAGASEPIELAHLSSFANAGKVPLKQIRVHKVHPVERREWEYHHVRL